MVLFNAPNRIGLGHINRLSNIAESLQGLCPSVRIAFVLEGGAHIFLDSRNIPYLPLPSSYSMAHPDVWSRYVPQERLHIQRQMIRSALESLRPDLVVFDCFPSYAFALETIGFGKPIVLCLREMGQMEKYLRVQGDILALVDRILIAHESGAFTLPEALAAKSTFVGTVARPVRGGLPRRHRAAGRVVISGGGGGFPGTVQFYNNACRAFTLARRERRGLEAILVAGPLFHDWLELDPAEGVRVVPYDPDPVDLFESAELVICQAGYNTIAELEQIGTRTLCVPAARDMDDQFARAVKFAAKRPNALVYTGSEAEGFATAILDCLQLPARLESTTRHEGAQVAAQCLASLLS
jgi:predicted glycosyltransferase